jgi:hypothetical protein
MTQSVDMFAIKHICSKEYQPFYKLVEENSALPRYVYKCLKDECISDYVKDTTCYGVFDKYCSQVLTKISEIKDKLH